jgi:hypothetical protein
MCLHLVLHIPGCTDYKWILPPKFQNCGLGIAIPSKPFTTHASPPEASRGFGVESGRFHAEGDQTFTVLERWAFLSMMHKKLGA